MSMLFKFRPLVVNPELAVRIGLNEAIVLQQVNYWLEEKEQGVVHQGRRWVFNSYEAWAQQFPFWSVDTVKRAFTSLVKQGCLDAEKLNKAQRDQTNYYAINHKCEALMDEEDMPSSNGANCPDGEGKLPSSSGAECPVLIGANCPDVPTEITTKTTTEITTETRARNTAKKSALDFSQFPTQPSPDVWADYVQHRKAKRAPISQTVLNLLAKELAIAVNAGWTVDGALAEAMAAGWQGLKAEWLLNRNGNPNGRAPPVRLNRQEALEARNAQIIDDFVDDYARGGEPW
ncbi:TPA: hypothetical protein SMF67_000828 [Serratia marcescens]|uniref:hypothetical protein n=1 Tax=Serratia marcescens TaxID=615 RepID=UPI0013DB3BE7|nr:hypothetical protein [Serratia marcescens]MDU7468772.1 hypothetical protein [Serratia marcescens]HEJ7090202.1 hypothetical protein [Serratia marcescens]